MRQIRIHLGICHQTGDSFSLEAPPETLSRTGAKNKIEKLLQNGNPRKVRAFVPKPTPAMKKSDLLRALQTEIGKHNLLTFMHDKEKVVITGCAFCRKHFGTIEQFKRHITDDVLPPLLNKLSVEAK